MVDPGSVSKSLYGLRSPILSSLPGMLYIYTPLSTCSHCLPELSHFHQWHHYCNIWRTGISICLPHLHCKATTWSLAVIHPLPKHKSNIITSTQDNHCGVLARRTHCRAIKSVESTPLHLKTQRSGSKLSHTSPSQDSYDFINFLWYLRALQMNLALRASLCWTRTHVTKPQALIRPEHTWGGYNLKELPFWGLREDRYSRKDDGVEKAETVLAGKKKKVKKALLD